jgi:hypothetical protein
MSASYRGPARAARPHPIVVRAAAAATLLVAASALLAPSRASAQRRAESKATNNESEWTSTSSGWIKDDPVHLDPWTGISRAPVGTWKEDYKHWFGTGREPAAWTTFGTPAKTPAAQWANRPVTEHDHTTTSAGGSTAKSEWYIRPTSALIKDVRRNRFFNAFATDYYTRSTANAKQGSNDQLANARTRVLDPFVFQSPATDPDWDSALPLDPDGKWTIGGQLAVWGSTSDVGTPGSLEWHLSLARNSLSPLSAMPLLDIVVDQSSARVTPDPSLTAQGRLYFADLDGNPLTAGDLQDVFEDYLTGSGWSLDPGFDAKSFDPFDKSMLARVLTFSFFVNLDQTTSSAALFTERDAYATAPEATVPEPPSLMLSGAGLLLVLARGARHVRRARSR